MTSLERSDAHLLHHLMRAPDLMPQLDKMPPLDSPPPALANLVVAPASLARSERLGGETRAEMEAEMEADMEELEKSLCTPSTMHAIEKDLCCKTSTMQELQNFLAYPRTSQELQASTPTARLRPRWLGASWPHTEYSTR